MFFSINYHNCNNFYDKLLKDVKTVCCNKQSKSNYIWTDPKLEIEFTLKINITDSKMLQYIHNLPFSEHRISTIYRDRKLKVRKHEYPNKKNTCRGDYEIKWTDKKWTLRDESADEYGDCNLSWKKCYEIDISDDFYHYAKMRFCKKSYKVMKLMHFQSPTHPSVKYRLGWSFITNEIFFESEEPDMSVYTFLNDIHECHPEIFGENLRLDVTRRLRNNDVDGNAAFLSLLSAQKDDDLKVGSI